LAQEYQKDESKLIEIQQSLEWAAKDFDLVEENQNNVPESEIVFQSVQSPEPKTETRLQLGS